jgi:hypothetical protein
MKVKDITPLSGDDRRDAIEEAIHKNSPDNSSGYGLLEKAGIPYKKAFTKGGRHTVLIEGKETGVYEVLELAALMLGYVIDKKGGEIT